MIGVASTLALALDPVAFATRLGRPPEAWQAKLLRSTAPRLAVIAARQVGKSEMIAIMALHAALFRPGALVLVVSGRLNQATEFLGKLRGHARLLDAPTEGETVTEVRFSNGSRVVALPATPDTTRGYSSAALIVLDEAAVIQDDVFHAVAPALAADGRLVALSSPGGPIGWLYDAWRDQGGLWEKHRVRASESGRYTPERLAELRRLVGEYSYRLDYEAEFGDAEGAVFGSRFLERAFTREVRPLVLEGID